MALGKLLNLQMGVTAQPPYRVMGGIKERCLAVSSTLYVLSLELLFQRPQPSLAVQAAGGLGGSSKALPDSIYGHCESHPGEEQGRPPSPRLPQLKGPSQR